MAGFAVSLTGAGTQTTGVVRCDQPRALDLRARGGKRVERVPESIVDEALSKVALCLNNAKHWRTCRPASALQ
jgi:mRNA interferase ChpB